MERQACKQLGGLTAGKYLVMYRLTFLTLFMAAEQCLRVFFLLARRYAATFASLHKMSSILNLEECQKSSDDLGGRPLLQTVHKHLFDRKI